MDLAKLLKVLHVLFAISWLGTLSVVMILARKGSTWADLRSEQCKSLCQKLYKTVEFPSMIGTLLLGLLLLFLVEINYKAGWFHMKMTAVIGLVVCDLWLGNGLCRYKKFPKKIGIVQSFVAGFALLLFFAIYGVRNKEKEWQQKFETNKKNAEIFSKSLGKNTKD